MDVRDVSRCHLLLEVAVGPEALVNGLVSDQRPLAAVLSDPLPYRPQHHCQRRWLHPRVPMAGDEPASASNQPSELDRETGDLPPNASVRHAYRGGDANLSMLPRSDTVVVPKFMLVLDLGFADDLPARAMAMLDDATWPACRAALRAVHADKVVQQQLRELHWALPPSDFCSWTEAHALRVCVSAALAQHVVQDVLGLGRNACLNVAGRRCARVPWELVMWSPAAFPLTFRGDVDPVFHPCQPPLPGTLYRTAAGKTWRSYPSASTHGGSLAMAAALHMLYAKGGRATPWYAACARLNRLPPREQALYVPVGISAGANSAFPAAHAPAIHAALLLLPHTFAHRVSAAIGQRCPTATFGPGYPSKCRDAALQACVDREAHLAFGWLMAQSSVTGEVQTEFDRRPARLPNAGPMVVGPQHAHATVVPVLLGRRQYMVLPSCRHRRRLQDAGRANQSRGPVMALAQPVDLCSLEPALVNDLGVKLAASLVLYEPLMTALRELRLWRWEAGAEGVDRLAWNEEGSPPTDRSLAAAAGLALYNEALTARCWQHVLSCDNEAAARRARNHAARALRVKLTTSDRHRKHQERRSRKRRADAAPLTLEPGPTDELALARRPSGLKAARGLSSATCLKDMAVALRRQLAPLGAVAFTVTETRRVHRNGFVTPAPAWPGPLPETPPPKRSLPMS